jgi:hypothetical protein
MRMTCCKLAHEWHTERRSETLRGAVNALARALNGCPREAPTDDRRCLHLFEIDRDSEIVTTSRRTAA